MQDKTKENIMKVIDILTKAGNKGRRREEFPEALQKAITVAIEKGLIHRQRKKWKRTFTGMQYSIWLKLGAAPVSAKVANVNNEPRPSFDELLATRKLEQYNERRKAFWKLASQLPAQKEIWKRLEALPAGDHQALTTLWQKVWAYYELGAITSEVHRIPSREELVKRIKDRKIKNTIASPELRKSSSAGFMLDRGDFRKRVKQLVTDGIITEATLTYILGKINALSMDDAQGLEELKQKVYTYYKITDDSQ